MMINGLLAWKWAGHDSGVPAASGGAVGSSPDGLGTSSASAVPSPCDSSNPDCVRRDSYVSPCTARPEEDAAPKATDSVWSRIVAWLKNIF